MNRSNQVGVAGTAYAVGGALWFALAITMGILFGGDPPPDSAAFVPSQLFWIVVQALLLFGFILKGASGEETVRALRAAAGGEAIFSPQIAKRIQQHFVTPNATGAFAELTEREQEILALLAQGLTNSAIAERLSLSVKTVRNRVSDIFSKLQVTDRGEAIIKARSAGIG